MDKAPKKNILVGIFVTIGLAIFLLAIFIIGSKATLFGKTFNVFTFFTNSAGLKDGSNVRFNGVKVGIVRSIQIINDTTIKVDLQIQESKQPFILKSAVATITSDGLMGDKLVNISPGDSGDKRMVINGDTIACNNPIPPDKLMQTLKATSEDIKATSSNLNKITTDIVADRGSIQMLYNDSVMARKLRESITNFNLSSQRILSASNGFQQISTHIKSGQGALGGMLYDSVMSRNLRCTMSTLKQTSDQLNCAIDELSQTIHKAN